MLSKYIPFCVIVKFNTKAAHGRIRGCTKTYYVLFEIEKILPDGLVPRICGIRLRLTPTMVALQSTSKENVPESGCGSFNVSLREGAVDVHTLLPLLELSSPFYERRLLFHN